MGESSLRIGQAAGLPHPWKRVQTPDAVVQSLSIKWGCMNCLVVLVEIVTLLPYMGDFGIKNPTKFDMLLTKENKAKTLTHTQTINNLSPISQH